MRLFYFCVADADLAVMRVAARVRAGGHDVPEATIRQRYERSVKNFFDLYCSLADEWRWYDNTDSGLPRPIAMSMDGKETIQDEVAWQAIRTRVQS